MAELIITEKPSVAQKIANALADGKIESNTYNKKVKYYKIKHGKNIIYVASAVGHLYNLAEKNKQGWTYPVFEVEWKPSYEINKASSYTKNYLNAIISIAKKCNSFCVATDYDIEGEVIGYNIIKYACKQKDARRMKYSTTTKEDLKESYDKALKHLNFAQTEAGLTRHTLDWWWGINLSRALTLSIRNATKRFKVLSIGRVQGPALKILAEREKEIKSFKPVPFWQIELISDKFSAWHKEDKIWDKKEADKILKKTKNKDAILSKIDKKEFKQSPPNPFDLTALQLEAYKLFNISPKQCLEIAQELYTNSYISYPRTSSNQLPETIGYKKIITALSKQKDYTKICNYLLSKKSLKPNNGKKKDPAHPAIYPTGEIPKNLEAKEKKVYDLIVRRTLASFGDPATRETLTFEIDVNKEIFIAKGTKTIDKGWHEIYGKYAKFEEVELPNLNENDKIKVKEIKLHEKETQPPKRYTPASIIKELEKLNLGTKATRAQIIDNLFERNYLNNKSIEVTDLGLKTVETLDKYCPEILDPNLTREFETDMEKITQNKKKSKDILEKAKSSLIKILNKFKKHEIKIGKELIEANDETVEQENTVGPCNKCKDGTLMIKYSPKFKTRFVACSKYPDCKNTFSLPRGLPKSTDKKCPECGFPMVTIIRAGKRPFDYCINKECPKKLEWIKQQQTKSSVTVVHEKKS
ncbi:DNA topoisomerase I [Candidatus Woesearchaeota archaeon]|nr:MAG: DNA topoisomerase I [Candidatus Woesearchaeota archaeon]